MQTPPLAKNTFLPTFISFRSSMVTSGMFKGVGLTANTQEKCKAKLYVKKKIFKASADTVHYIFCIDYLILL